MDRENEPQFIVRVDTAVAKGRPEFLTFRILSKVQRSSGPHEQFASVEELLETDEIPSALFLLKTSVVEELCIDLLSAARDARNSD